MPPRLLPNLTLVLTLLGAAACGGTPAPQAAAPPWPPPGHELPAELVDGHFVLGLRTADGGELHLFTDTGGGLAVRASTVARLGGDAAAEVWELPEMAAGWRIPAPPRGLHVAADEATPASLPDGMLGAPWFSGRVWTFDYPGGRLLIHGDDDGADGTGGAASSYAPSYEVPPALAPHTVPLGLQTDDAGQPTTGFPRLGVDVAGEPVDLLLDTGAGEELPAASDAAPGTLYPVSFIVRSRADAWRQAHPEWPILPLQEQRAGEADGYWIRVPEVRLAGHEVGPLWFSTRPDASFHDYMSQWMDRPVDGALGGKALAGLVVTVDYPAARAVFQRPAPEPDRLDLDALDTARRLESHGQAAYGQQHWAESARLYDRAASLGAAGAATDHYNAACSLALGGDLDGAFEQLQKALDAGFHDADLLAADGDLEALRGDVRWSGIQAATEERREKRLQRMGDPANARLVTEDVPRFWTAFDAAAGVESERERTRLFADLYLEPGSVGLRDFYLSRIQSADLLAAEVARSGDYYAAVRANTLAAEAATDQVREAMQRLEEIYPPAVFPNVYFLVGRLTSGGTTSPAGLLIGTELYGLDPDTAVPERLRHMAKPAAQLPHIVAHELIHYQQSDHPDGSLLSFALHEGCADFLAELILPGAESHYRTWGRQHENQIRERFLREMDGSERDDWFYNYGQASEDWPADLGYFVGARICEAYYDQAEDKTAAVRDLLAAKDAKEIWQESGYGSP